MPQEKKEPTEQETPAFDREEFMAEVQRRIDGAHKDSLKKMQKAITEAVTNAITTKPAEEDQPDKQPADAGKGAAQPSKASESPEYKALLKRVEASEKKQKELEDARIAEAKGRREDAAKASLRRAYEAAGVRPETLDKLVAAAMLDGTLRFDEDGKPLLSVKRARTKGAAAEEQHFEDFAQGMADWKQSPEAAAFLKPQQGATTATAPRAPANGAVKTFSKAPVDEEDGVNQVIDLMNQQGTG